MRARTWLLVVLVGLGGLGGWWLLGRSSDDASLGPGGSAGPHAADARLGPLLEGAPREAADARDATGRHAVRVRVTDEMGRSAAGVRVTARRIPDEGVPYATRRSVEEQTFVRRLASPGTGPEPASPHAEGATGHDGTSWLHVAQSVLHEVRAEPEAPLVGTTALWDGTEGLFSPPIELRVRPGSRIVGRVVDGQGRGRSARVWAEAALATDERPWTSPQVPTDAASGRFVVPAVPLGPLGIGVLVPGRFRGVLAQVTAPHEGEVIIRLEQDAPLLTGVVRTTAGEPIEDAYVAIRLGPSAQEGQPGVWAHHVELLAPTDARGAYALAGSFAGRVEQVTAAGPGTQVLMQDRRSSSWQGLELAPGRVATLDLVLHRGGVLEGRMLEVGTRRPLPGAVIRLNPRNVVADAPLGRDMEAVSDAQGRYRLAGVALGMSVLTVRHVSHHLPAQALARDVPGESDREGSSWQKLPPPDLLVFVASEGARVERELLLARGVAVRGRVVGPDGEHVHGALVRAWLDPDGGEHWGVKPLGHEDPLAVTKEDGSFEIPGLPPGTGWRLIAEQPPLRGMPGPPLSLEAGGEAAEVSLRLLRGTTLSGRVVGAKGQPAGDVRVSVYVEGWPPYQSETRAGPDGTFRFDGVAPGAAHVDASGPQGFGAVEVPAPPAGAPFAAIEIVLDAEGPTFRLKAFDERGRPAAGVSLWVSTKGGPSMWTCDAHGVARVGLMEPGPFSIRNVPSGPALAEGTFPLEELRVVVPATATRLLEATVTDEGGRPVPFARVWAALSPRSGTSVVVVHGSLRLPVETSGPIRLRVHDVRDERGRPLNLRSKEVELPEVPLEPLRIRLEAGHEVGGTVVDETGQGIEHAHVSCDDIECRTDAQGSFVIGGLERPAEGLHVRAPSPFISRGVDDLGQDLRQVCIVLVRGGAISGIVLREDDHPPPRALIRACRTDDSCAYVYTDQGGSFRMDGLPHDAVLAVSAVGYDVEGEELGTAITLRNVRVGTMDMRLVLPRRVRVTGRVVDHAGRPYTDGQVIVSHAVGMDSEGSYEVDVDSMGRFLHDKLVDGQEVHLSATTRDGGVSSPTLTVHAPIDDVVLRLPELHPIAGRLEGSTSTADWTLIATRVEQGERTTLQADIGADGLFRLDGTTLEGSFTLLAWASGSGDRYAVLPGVRAGSTDVRLVARIGRIIEGAVRDEAGRALPDAWVQFAEATLGEGAHIRTDASGAYRLTGLPPGAYRIRAFATDYEHEMREDVSDGSSGVDFVLKRSTR